MSFQGKWQRTMTFRMSFYYFRCAFHSFCVKLRSQCANCLDLLQSQVHGRVHKCKIPNYYINFNPQGFQLGGGRELSSKYILAVQTLQVNCTMLPFRLSQTLLLLSSKPCYVSDVDPQGLLANTESVCDDDRDKGLGWINNLPTYQQIHLIDAKNILQTPGTFSSNQS